MIFRPNFYTWSKNGVLHLVDGFLHLVDGLLLLNDAIRDLIDGFLWYLDGVGVVTNGRWWLVFRDYMG